jgi:hypothetical protein
LEAYDIPFTFSGAATIALRLDKDRPLIKLKNTIDQLKSYGIPPAPFALISYDDDYSKYTTAMNCRYPFFGHFYKNILMQWMVYSNSITLISHGDSEALFSSLSLEHSAQLHPAAQCTKPHYVQLVLATLTNLDGFQELD